MRRTWYVVRVVVRDSFVCAGIVLDVLDVVVGRGRALLVPPESPTHDVCLLLVLTGKLSVRSKSGYQNAAQVTRWIRAW
jgi:hypothetical protein